MHCFEFLPFPLLFFPLCVLPRASSTAGPLSPLWLLQWAHCMELDGGTTHTSKDADLYNVRGRPGVGELCWVSVLAAAGAVHYLL